jgi:amidase
MAEPRDAHLLASNYDVVEKSVSQLQTDMSSGRVSAQQLVAAYFARMDALDHSGPTLNSVLARNPRASAR